MGKTRYPAKFLETFAGKSWVTDIPFDLTIDVLPELLRDPDCHLQHLAAEGPPDVAGFEDIAGESRVIRDAVGRAKRAVLRGVSILLLGADEKRLHTFEELRHASEGWLSATSENMTIHIDMNARKTAPFPPDIRARIQAVADSHAAVPRPEGTGRVAVEEPVPPGELVHALARHEVGVVINRPVTRNDELVLPNKLFEYLMAGLAVVAPRLPGMAPLVQGEQLGMMFEPGRPDQLAATAGRRGDHEPAQGAGP